MSLTSKQIDELRAYAADRKGELAKLIKDAADTIELLSAKLHASQMERSSQYYHGGWIPCSERLPEVGQVVLRTIRDFSWNGEKYFRVDVGIYNTNDGSILAWMPLPEPYKERREE